jgi:hypothetical protein
VIIDEYFAEQLYADQHGPSAWRTLTDAGRKMYVQRYQQAYNRVDLIRREHNGEFD